MRRLFFLLFALAGLAICGQLHAQTPAKKPKKATKESAPANKSNDSGSGAGGITIDEGGQSRPTKGRQQSTAPGGSSTSDSTKVTPSNNQDATPKSGAPESSAPQIAIDEGGQTRPGRGSQQSNGDTPPQNSDSAIKAPADLLSRPKF